MTLRTLIWLIAFAVTSVQSVVAAPITYHCVFPQTFSLGEGLHPQDFEFTLAYDSITQTAALIGNVGVSTLSVFVGSEATSFMEYTGSGVVQTLTIRPSGQAVYSRHTVNLLDDGFIASQNYGTCTP
jgi:hypothetical protein